MIFYITLSLVVFCFFPFDFPGKGSIYSKNTDIFKKILFILFGVLFIILGGVRWLTGTDWNNYSSFFLENNDWESFVSYRFEPGFTFLNFAIKQISDSYTLYLFVFSVLVIVFKLKCIKKISIYPFLSLFLYVCFYQADIMAVRNALGVSILLMSIPLIEENKKREFFFIVLLATSIHYSCAFWIFSYSIYHSKIKRNTWIVMIIISLPFLFLGKYIYPIIINLILKPFGAVSIIIEKILFYSNDYHEPTATFLKQMLSIIKRLLFLPMFFIYYSTLEKQSKYNHGLLNLYMFGNFIYILFFNSMQQMNRMIIANIFLEVILLPEFVRCFKKKPVKLVFIFVLFLYGLFKLIISIIPFYNEIVPFYTVFNFQYREM